MFYVVALVRVKALQRLGRKVPCEVGEPATKERTIWSSDPLFGRLSVAATLQYGGACNGASWSHEFLTAWVTHWRPACSSLRASAYAGFRAPTVNELYKPFRLPGGIVNEANPELVPETLVGAEIGFDWSRPGLFGRVTAFWNEVDDPVINLTLENAGPGGGFIAPCGFVPPNGVCRQRTNIGQQRAFGIEFDLSGRFAARWSWGFNGVLSDLEVTEAPGAPQLVGLRPRLIPETTLNGRLEWRDPTR